MEKENPEAGDWREGKLGNGTGMGTWELKADKRGNIYSKDGLKGGGRAEGESWPMHQTW